MANHRLSDLELIDPAYAGPLTAAERLAILHERLSGATMTGIELRALRKTLGMNRDQVAERLGVHWQTVGNWERAGATVPPDHAARIRRLQAMPGTVLGLSDLGVGDTVCLPEGWDPTPAAVEALYRGFRKHRGKGFEMHPRASIGPNGRRIMRQQDWTHDGRFVVVRVR